MDKECWIKIKVFLSLLVNITKLSNVFQSFRVVENKVYHENVYSNNFRCVWTSDLFGTGFSGATKEEAREI